MNNTIQREQLLEMGIAESVADTLIKKINSCLTKYTSEEAWQIISKTILTPHLPFKLHLFLFTHLFPEWPYQFESAPAWIPDKNEIATSNLTLTMSALNRENLQELYAWSVNDYEKFWDYVINTLRIVFHTPPNKICDLSNSIESPQWLKGASLNITESCFTAPPSQTAILYKNENNLLQKISYDELNRLSNRIANGLIALNFSRGDAIAIDMPMTHFAVAIYLGIIKMGGVVVSIADSFSTDEIATRLRIAKAKAVFTQDIILRDAKNLPLYEKVSAAHAPLTIVIPAREKISTPLRAHDLVWEDFLSHNEQPCSVSCEPMAPCNILFSSGTTAEPKAIPWNHTTPIKVASDAFFHQNIKANDVLAWPTNLGWMMGPWLIFAALINHATIALYDGVPRDRAFGQFIEDAKVTMLGVVPTLVATWRQSHCMEGLDWQSIKSFSSTGECSNPEDMLYLMSLAGYKPVIEYCGGTEIGGGYVTSTVIEKNYPSTFSMPTLGTRFILLDENNQPSNTGEVAIIPPAIGLSTELLNADHHQIYFASMPRVEDRPIRRHGDQLRRLANGYYCVLGRADDTMNLGAIKISSAEIERVLVGIEYITETAAIAVSPAHGPSHLVIYAVTQQKLNKDNIKREMQNRINLYLNPLFRINDVVFINELPKTASNKIMRRVLRKQYNV